MGEMVKVKLESPDGDVETLWATSLGDGVYQLDNSPFFAYGVSWGDAVEARIDSMGQLAMTRVVRKSGHRTIRLILADPGSRAEPPLLEELKALGCTFEGASPRYLSVDIPPGVALGTIADLLVASDVQWEYADPTYEEVQQDSGTGH